MKRELPGGFELDDSVQRIDVKEVHRFLSTESYWAKGRSFELQDLLIHNAQRVCGLYHNDRQIGFSRTVSDGVVFAYLADVYVLPEYRNRHFGAMIIRFSVEEGPFANLTWMLHTVDAHGLYKQFGFGAPTARLMERYEPG
jgi:ribosomal protein S18 acetylase RimI-like enzyme